MITIEKNGKKEQEIGIWPKTNKSQEVACLIGRSHTFLIENAVYLRNEYCPVAEEDFEIWELHPEIKLI